MSKKYCAIPTLDIVPAESLLAAANFAVITGALCIALLGLFQQGYPLLTLLLSPVMLLALVSLWRDRPAGCRLYWKHGQWSVARRRAEALQPAEVNGVLLPFLVLLRITPGSRDRRWAWLLFHDSLGDEDVRALRRVLLAHR